MCCGDQISRPSTAVPISLYTNKLTLLFFYTAFSNTSNFTTEFEQSALDCRCRIESRLSTGLDSIGLNNLQMQLQPCCFDEMKDIEYALFLSHLNYCMSCNQCNEPDVTNNCMILPLSKGKIKDMRLKCKVS